MKKLLEFFRQNPLPIVRDQDLIKAPKPFCRDLMPNGGKGGIYQVKCKKGYKKPFVKRTQHK